MRGKIYSKLEKDSAKTFVLEGKSYGEITKKLNIPKSTLSTWFGKTLKKRPSRQDILDHLTKVRKLATLAIKEKYAILRKTTDSEIKSIVEKEIYKFPHDNIAVYKALVAMLYWAEGSKHEKASGTKFVNTDPSLVNFYLTLLRRCYKINESKIRINLYLHYYHPIRKTRLFWSEALSVPLDQFNKIYIKKRSVSKRFRKNFVGICAVYYGDSKIRKEIMMLANSLKEHIV